MNQTTQIVFAVLGSGGLFTLINTLIARHDAKKKAVNPELFERMIACLNAVTQDRIVYLSRKYLERGCISFDDKEDLQEIYDAYRDAGGNHKAEAYWKKVDAIKVVSHYKEDYEDD